MKILIKYPTRKRPDKFIPAFDLYYKMLSGKHDFQFMVSMDNDDVSMKNDKILKFLDLPHVSYNYSNNKTKVQAVNADMSNLYFDILLLASDDMLPLAKDYDDIIIQNMLRFFPLLDGCLHFNDGFKPQLNTLSIMGVNLYKHFGYIYHPDYISLWCDNEYQEVTERANKAVYINETIIKHEWTNYTGIDELHKHNEQFYLKDKQTFEKRKALNFPKESVHVLTKW